eukprot:TRINITY_DN12799_c1_g1_i3.p2 TRINITY_DN12799_c1_g1~~TRINITY_DN12799_c1_g1_i3.p2  ORF type:complete len:302 (+),score=23.69 TRINITY_DN12799_c1_g1_i3:114-1019(+)
MGLAKLALQLLQHPEEITPTVRMYFAVRQATKLPSDPNLAFCYDILNKVSRSFAVVIQQLPVELRNAICIFYLVLRGLDTVEDDMSIPIDVKVPLLKTFCQKHYDKDFKLDYGEKHYKRLLNNYGIVVQAFMDLKETYQTVILDICRDMGNGMAEFIEREVVTVADYDLYCHYVAGLVGYGLSRLFARCGLEDPKYETLDELSNHMGLFLQKTNIIRDYLEDINEEPAPRMFWPKEIWGLYGKELVEFKEDENAENAVKCLNHLVTDALRHAAHCLQYMKDLKHPMVFRFCAIPQVFLENI